MGSTMPYGNKLGLWGIVITINDLVINNAGLRKFVADFTTSEVVYKQEPSGLRTVTDKMS